ncbi:J domain-containing protein [Hymenobacter jejuensis]|uniref:J domain-containing protein n=1 Tax=Hymenobacter jejuensis TaxID=2502781 RepID=A0A5B8A0I7_9BACT|nr:J domain-containing protein [Hymenobacter jejuensis]QDA60589.1 J domain-containing protein [Hymenobacter jejuensis]
MTHYQTLEVSEQATPDEIRRAYRRLVLLTHPDRTPDPVAHARYLSINQAYDVLIDPTRRQYYDAQLWAWRNPPVAAPVAQPPHPRDRHYGTRRAARPIITRPGPRPAPYAAEYAHYAPKARLVCLMLLTWFALMALDRLAVQRYPNEVVQSREFHSFAGRNFTQVWHSIRTPHATFRIYDDTIGWPAVDQHIAVARTPVFGIVTSVADADSAAPQARLHPPSIYNLFAPLPLAMALTAALGVLPTSTNQRRVDACVVAVLLALLTLIMLFFYR